MRPTDSTSSACQSPPPGGGGTAVAFVLGPAVPLEEAAATLELARMAVESLYGPVVVTLDSACRLDRPGRTITIDTATEVGRSWAAVFGGYLAREFGPAAATVARSTFRGPGATRPGAGHEPADT